MIAVMPHKDGNIRFTSPDGNGIDAELTFGGWVMFRPRCIPDCLSLALEDVSLDVEGGESLALRSDRASRSTEADLPSTPPFRNPFSRLNSAGDICIAPGWVICSCARLGH